MPYYLLLPLFAAIIYAVGSILIKRALKVGVSMDQSFHLTNFIIGLVFAPLLLFETKDIDWSGLWRPLVMGFVFFVGNWLTFLAIKRGDVSLVTPLMGTKVVFVAISLVFFAGKMPSQSLWIAAVMTSIGILVMGLADYHKGHHVIFTIVVTLASAALFGFCDVLVNSWAPGFGPLSFIAIGSIFVAFCSLVMWGLQGFFTLRIAAPGSIWTGIGAFCVGIQAILIGAALSFFDDATGINIMYASRGLWVIILVVVFGTFLGNSEHQDTGRAFLWRVVGTVILTAAIVIAVVDRAGASASS